MSDTLDDIQIDLYCLSYRIPWGVPVARRRMDPTGEISGIVEQASVYSFGGWR